MATPLTLRSRVTNQPSGNRRERHRAQTRDRLYRAALQLFAERGFLETTVEDITESADVGKGTFFNYFPTKEHILSEFGGERTAAVERALNEARTTAGSVLEVIGQLCVDCAGQSDSNAPLLRAIFAAHASCAPVRAALQKRAQIGRRMLTEMFQIGQDRGEIRTDIAAGELARTTQMMVMGLAMAWSIKPDATLRKHSTEIWKLLGPSLQPSAPGASGKVKSSAKTNNHLASKINKN